MKIKFEQFINDNQFSGNATSLFNSAVACYRADVSIASLLLSYIGFLAVLKDRVMNAAIPPVYNPVAWSTLIKNLQNEDKWEEAIFDASQQQIRYNQDKRVAQDPVFNISDPLRQQIRYWKDRRNDCAHNKDNAITIHHVETFWSFLQSNLKKITVEGGKASLLNKISRHYDTFYTPAGQDVLPLVREIKESVEYKQLSEFWTEVFERIGDLMDYDQEVELVGAVLKNAEPLIRESLINHVKEVPSLLLACLSHSPSIILELGLNSQTLRKFLFTKLQPNRNPLGIYACVLRNNLLPEAEIAETNNHLSRMPYTTNINDHAILQLNGFGEAIFTRHFVDRNVKHYQYWQYLNENAQAIIRYIEMYPLKKETVEILIPQLAKREWAPQFLQNGMTQFFSKNETKKAEFIGIATELALEIPSYLKP